MKTFDIQNIPAYLTVSQALFAILFTTKLISGSELPYYGVPPTVRRTTRPSLSKSDLSGIGTLDVYKNFQWDVKKGNGDEESTLSNGIQKQAVLDLALVMDCTGSMGAWIEHSKKTLNTVIDNIKNNASSSQFTLVRVAFVGFRDFGDGNSIFSVHDFTSDIKAIKDFISNQHASGGGDLPEDVVGAMHQVLQLSWYPDSFRLATVIADAPTHGNRYHSQSMSDDYPEGSPAGLVLEEMVKKYRTEKLDLTFYKLTENTEVMYNVIEDVNRGHDWVDFVDIRHEIQANRELGYGDDSDYVADAYATRTSDTLSYRVSSYKRRANGR